MLSHAQGVILCGWLGAGLTLVGWGVLVRRLAGESGRTADDLCDAFWLGWAAVLGALQLAHFLIPIGAAAQSGVAAIGLVGLAAGGARAWRRVARRAPANAPVLLAVAALGWWLSDRALGGPRFGDTGGYYVPTIRWVIEYPIVVGLGNLYAPYAYNQSYFLYAALLSAGPFAGRSHHLLNGLLLLALGARGALGGWRVLRLRAPCRPVDLFHALLLPAEATLAFSFLFTSPAPDFALFALGIALCSELMALLTEPPARARSHFLAVTLLAAVGPTVKLGFAGMSAAALAVAAWWWIRRARPTWRAGAPGMCAALAIVLLVIGPWIGGNVLMSGCPLFPSALGALPVEWRVEWDVQHWIANTMHLGGDWRVAVNNPGWFLRRLDTLGWAQRDAALPLAIAAAALPLGIARRALTRAGRPQSPVGLPLALILPPLASFAFCFVYAPVPRYAGAAMWLLGAEGMMLALGAAMFTRAGRVASVAVSVALALPPFFDGEPIVLRARDFEPSPSPRVERVPLASGLDVYVPPENNPACWNAPLPCTPRLHPGLRLRRPGDLGSGFAVDRSTTSAAPAKLPP